MKNTQRLFMEVGDVLVFKSNSLVLKINIQHITLTDKISLSQIRNLFVFLQLLKKCSRQQHMMLIIH